MSLLPSSALLEEILRTVARRYRLPAMAAQVNEANPATALAMAIEKARQARSANEVPDPALKHGFIEALAQMIREAMRPESGDPAFQAMVLRHEAAQVREYAALSAHADQDRRLVHTMVNAIAHPAKQHRLAPGRQREALARLHASASSVSWSELSDTAQALLSMPEIANESPLRQGVARVLDSPALRRLRRGEALASDELVRRYQSLWDKHGPRPASPTALAQGSASQRRGAAVETLATEAVEALAKRLNEDEKSGGPYRVVTSMRVPASISTRSHRAKSEWDVVLLRHAKTVDATPAWDVCLLVEAKASVDAAATDLSRLLRGLRLLAQADKNFVYAFNTRQGVVNLRGVSLSALASDKIGLVKTVLYCCDAPVETAPRLLGAAGRMQLLSAQASLEFACNLAEKQSAEPQGLEPVWNELLESPRWSAVLHQYPTLCQVRELMVNIDDLWSAINDTTQDARVVGLMPGKP